VKPGAGDVPLRVKFVGAQLRELRKLSYAMVEAFGLDRRIAAYKGTRPIRLYPWDFDCLEAVVDEAVREAEAVPRPRPSRLLTLRNLQTRIQTLRKEAYKDR
jgi:hypothetical protein